MATLTASKAQTGISPKGVRVGLVAVQSIYSVDAALSAGDVVQMVKVPANATPVYLSVSGGSGACTIQVGDGGSVARYVASVSASAAYAVKVVDMGLKSYTYSVDDTIDITIASVVTGTVEGAFNVLAIFSMDV